MGLSGAGGTAYLCPLTCIAKFLITQIIKNHKYEFELPIFSFFAFVGRAAFGVLAGLLG